MITFSSIYGLKSREPMIHFKWGKEEGSLSVTEARAHAIAVLETIEAAIGDAFLFEFSAKFDPENPDKAGAVMLGEFREWRQQKGYGGGIDPTDHRPYKERK